MENRIIVSICIPVYKVENYIKECAVSLFNQTARNQIEYIFVDDYSPDESINILNEVIDQFSFMRNQIKIIKHKQNLGLAKARETAIKEANGIYIFHCDSDDYLQLDAIQNLLESVENKDDYDIISGSVRSIYPNRVNIIPCPDSDNPKTIAIEMIERKRPYNIWNRLIKKELYDGLEIPNINNGEDYITTCRLFYKASKILNIDKVTYNYTHFNNNSFQKTGDKIDNINDLTNSSTYLKNYFSGDLTLKTPLNIGHLMAYGMALLSCRNIKTIKSIKIPDNLLAYSSFSNIGKTNLVFFLYKLRLWRAIKCLNYIRFNILSK